MTDYKEMAPALGADADDHFSRAILNSINDMTQSETTADAGNANQRRPGHCGMCRAFLDYEDGSNMGECRRHAPKPSFANSFGWDWPRISIFGHCIEHLPNGRE